MSSISVKPVMYGAEGREAAAAAAEIGARAAGAGPKAAAAVKNIILVAALASKDTGQAKTAIKAAIEAAIQKPTSLRKISLAVIEAVGASSKVGISLNGVLKKVETSQKKLERRLERKRKAELDLENDRPGAKEQPSLKSSS